MDKKRGLWINDRLYIALRGISAPAATLMTGIWASCRHLPYDPALLTRKFTCTYTYIKFFHSDIYSLLSSEGLDLERVDPIAQKKYLFIKPLYTNLQNGEKPIIHYKEDRASLEIINFP